MDFDKKCHEIFRNWYVDGRVYYLKVIDMKRPQDGIQDLRYIDPLKIKYIRQEKKKKGSDPTIRVRQQEEEVPNQNLMNIMFIHLRFNIQHLWLDRWVLRIK